MAQPQKKLCCISEHRVLAELDVGAKSPTTTFGSLYKVALIGVVVVTRPPLKQWRHLQQLCNFLALSPTK